MINYNWVFLQSNNLTRFIAGLLGFFLVIPLCAADVYKWTDSTGKTHYTDSPPVNQIQHEQINIEECKTDMCKNDLKRDQEEAARQLQETEDSFKKQDAEQKTQAKQQQSKKNHKKPPPRSGYLGH